MTLLDDICRAAPPSFAVVRRAAAPTVDAYVGDVRSVARLADLPLPALSGATSDDLLALVPYRQLTERGLPCVDDGAPLLALRVRAHERIDLAAALAGLPDDPLEPRDGRFDRSDAAYAELVRQLQTAEIGGGAGSNFVLRRTYLADLGPVGARAGLSIFRRLLAQERGAYWTFLVHVDGRMWVGATPERHVSVRDRRVSMTPISGTYRYPSGGATVEGVLDFLADDKEIDELSMVVDEELKMLGAVCPDGGRVAGPRLRAMARLAHTEYSISATSPVDVRSVLAATLFAPTVVGSPLARAAEVVSRYEGTGRGYYGGVLALFGQDRGERTLDSAICIRTAAIDSRGRLALDVGATVVRGSDPLSEAAETTAKAAALLAAVGGPETRTSAGADPGPAAGPRGQTAEFGRIAADPRVRAALAGRVRQLAGFWLADSDQAPPPPALAGRDVLIVDAEDDFTRMLGHLVAALGATVEIQPHHAYAGPAGADTVIVGPGPGDPLDRTDPRIATLHRITRDLLDQRTPFLSVCLGHQVLAATLGLSLRRRPVPAQGTQRLIPFGGRLVRVGFYNTFHAISPADGFRCPITGERVSVARDPATGEVFGLALPGVRSVQFHAESILTQDGPGLLAGLLAPLRRAGAGADLARSDLACSAF